MSNNITKKNLFLFDSVSYIQTSGRQQHLNPNPEPIFEKSEEEMAIKRTTINTKDKTIKTQNKIIKIQDKAVKVYEETIKVQDSRINIMKHTIDNLLKKKVKNKKT